MARVNESGQQTVWGGGHFNKTGTMINAMDNESCMDREASSIRLLFPLKDGTKFGGKLKKVEVTI